MRVTSLCRTMSFLLSSMKLIPFTPFRIFSACINPEVCEDGKSIKSHDPISFSMAKFPRYRRIVGIISNITAMKLLCDCVLERFTCLEEGNLACRDLDLFASLGVTADTNAALLNIKNAEANRNIYILHLYLLPPFLYQSYINK